MSSEPVVSIAVPCHNEARLLRWALASVLAQSYDRWECIVVDDGSVDQPIEVVDTLGDPRIQLIRLDRNLGRAVARQAALDAATGAYLTTLDADDWLYPEKLERQLAVIEGREEVAVVSTGTAIEDESQQLAGVRGKGTSSKCETRGPIRRLASPPVGRAPSMVRMAVARLYAYNSSLRRSEDADFLLHVLLENRYCVMRDVLYAYREYRSASRREVLEAYRYRMQMFWAFRSRFPFAAPVRTAESALKWVLYWAAFAVKRADVLLQRRSEIPSEEDLRQFRNARQKVEQVYAEYFGAVNTTTPTERYIS